jgi:type II restriction enzyme
MCLFTMWWGCMPSIKEAQTVLAALGMPPAQCNEISALTLLALCGLKPDDPWMAAQRRSMTISKDIMAFIREAYAKHYAPNTRETFRRQVLHQFLQAHLVDYNPDMPALPTNSPKAHYAISVDALAVIQQYGSDTWINALAAYGRAKQQPPTARDIRTQGVILPDGTPLRLSPGEHNALQVLVIEQFLPQFAAGAQLLYLGDTANKDLYIATSQLVALGIDISMHGKLPDIILYDAAQHWLYLFEVVTSHGPMTPKRVVELSAMLERCSAGKIYVTAFASFTDFRKHMRSIAWESEVWIAEVPEHLIHFNGDRFLGPR